MKHQTHFLRPQARITKVMLPFVVMILMMLIMGPASAFAGGALEIAADTGAPEGHSVYRFEGGYIDLSVEGENLRIEMKAPTTGWVAVGFDPESRMLGADFIIGYVRNGEVVIDDHYGHTATGHQADADNGGSYDILESSGSEDDSGTTLTALIPLDSGDERDSTLQSGGEHLMLVAYGPRGADNLTAIHAGRGSVTVRIP